LKGALIVSKDKIINVGKNLADATAAGVIAAKKRFVENGKTVEGDTALAAPNDKK